MSSTSGSSVCGAWDLTCGGNAVLVRSFRATLVHRLEDDVTGATAIYQYPFDQAVCYRKCNDESIVMSTPGVFRGG
ncbi:hypothetical protein F2Q68_00033600 [Brassica cretica]|uniref:Uncharacterized protein n=1 Tax=Brassica cretica TaxID=69181 RepID=A0A8S9H988_BRACR|nr:hypothetical protein F2Q68_00033600 [Brassica cretica]